MTKLSGAYAAVRVSKLLENLTIDEKHDVLEFCLKCVQADLEKEYEKRYADAQEKQAAMGISMKEPEDEPA